VLKNKFLLKMQL